MIELIQNTLELLLKLTGSKTGYLLNLCDKSYEIITFVGEQTENTDELFSSILSLYSKKQLSEKTLGEQDSSINFLKKNKLESLTLKEIKIKESEDSDFYILLLSDNKVNSAKSPDSLNEFILNKITGQLEKVLNYKKLNNKFEDSNNWADYTLTSLYNEKEKLNLVFESCDDFAFVLDRYGCFVKVNSFGVTNLDFQINELLGKHFMDIVASRDKQAASEAFQKVLHSGQFESIEIKLIGKYGNELVCVVNAEPIIEDDKIINLVGLAKDVTQLRQYEAQIEKIEIQLIEAKRLISIERSRSKQQKSFLEELNRLKSEFISNISHELRTPLASIIGFSETILSDSEMPKDMQKEFNQIIFNEGKRLAKLVDDVLDVTRFERGKLELDKTEFDIIEVLGEIIETNKPAADKRNITMTIDMPREEVILIADKSRIEKVFDGLLNNAVKFTGEGGRITVSAQNIFKEFEVIISDTGIGIPKKDLEHIFDKFYRVSRPGTEIPGTGLGLVFVKQIVDLHKGFISVQSEMNSGTTFIVKLPREN